MLSVPLRRSPAPDRRRTRTRSLRVVGDKEPRRRLAGVVGTLSVSLLFLVLLAMAVFHALIVQGQNDLDELDERIQEAHVHNDELRLELARLEAPERIVAVATKQLGMVRAPEVSYLTPGGASTIVTDRAPGAVQEP